MTRPLVLCADDFALAEGVSRAIVALLERARLSATSCMSLSPSWPRHASWLRPFAGEVDIGLHLTLTELEPLGPMATAAASGRLPSLGGLARQVAAGALDLAAVRAELARQFDAFAEHWGRAPDFVDGHQHVHLLPRVRNIVLDLVQERAPGAYVRQCWEPPVWILRRGVAVPRALTIAALSLGLRRRLGERGNDSFRGVSDFRPGADYRRDFRRYLTGPGRRPLIMCHPGHVDDELRRLDPVTDHRENEFRYFSGDVFLDDVAAAGYRLARMT